MTTSHVPTTQSLVARTEALLGKCQTVVRGVERDLIEIKALLAPGSPGGSGLTEIQRLMIGHGLSILEDKLAGISSADTAAVGAGAAAQAEDDGKCSD